MAPCLRHPGTASRRSAGRRIRDPCLAVHPRDPVHDEARGAGRRRCPCRILQRLPPLRRRLATPPPPPLRGVEEARPKRRRPSSNPTKWGGGAERSEAEGGTPPDQSATMDGRHDGRGQAVHHAPAHRRPEDPTRRAAPPTFVIPERRPSAAQDDVSGIHASPSIPALRCRTTHRSPPFPSASSRQCRRGLGPASAPPLHAGSARGDDGEGAPGLCRRSRTLRHSAFGGPPPAPALAAAR